MQENPANAGFLGYVRRGRVASSDLQALLAMTDAQAPLADADPIEPRRVRSANGMDRLLSPLR